MLLRIVCHQQLDKLAIEFMLPLYRLVGRRFATFIQLAHSLKEYGKYRFQYLLIVQRVRQGIGTNKQAKSITVQLSYFFRQRHNGIIQNHRKKIQKRLHITYPRYELRRKTGKTDTGIRRYFVNLNK